MQFTNPLYSAWKVLRVAAPPLMIVVVTVALGFLFHVRGQQVVEEQLRERMLSTVAIAALQIDVRLVEQVRTDKDMQKQAYKTLVRQLKTIRELSPHTRFSYIMRRTDDPLTLSFVADADGLSTAEELDTNGNGQVDDDEVPGLTGDAYSIDDIPTLQGIAFEEPVVEQQITEDQWGRLISAFAPIKNANGETVAVLGMDMKADEFFEMTNATFSMVAVLLVSLVGTLLAVYILLMIRARHLETLQELDVERTALLDLATHQLGMPLATFRWWLEILKERDNGTFCKRGDVCDQLQEGIDRMDTIIRGLQQAGGLKEKAFSKATDRASLSDVSKIIQTDLKKTLALRGQSIKTTIPKNLPAVHLDINLCTGMLRELLENASFYSPHKAIIGLSARAVRGNVEISVTDHGYGIPQNDLPQIFQQFKRGSNASKYKPAGNGLGLYIVRRIVERARGKIRINSELNKGTIVTVLLPIAA
jgi:signal transduction histidine kinase